MGTSISIYSVVYAILVSEFLLFCMIAFCKSCGRMEKGDFITATMMGLLCLCRILLPIDLRSSHAVTFDGVYEKFCSVLMKHTVLFERKLEVWHGVVLVIGIAAFLKMIKFLLEYKAFISAVASMEPYQAEALENVFPEDLLQNYDIRISSDIKIPYGIGIFHKYIVLPRQKYSEDELRYALMHEIQHFQEGDLLIKFVMEIVCRILWWNPLFRKIQDVISRAIEVRCDLHVTDRLSLKEKKQYMMALVHAAQGRNDTNSMKQVVMTSLGESSERLRERIEILCGKTEKKEGMKQKLVAVLTVALFLLSYSVLPVCHYSAPVSEIEEDGAQAIDLNTSMLIYQNGKYRLLDEKGDFICEFEEDSDTANTLQFLINNEQSHGIQNYGKPEQSMK